MRDLGAGVKSKSAPRHNGKRKEKKDEYEKDSCPLHRRLDDV